MSIITFDHKFYNNVRYSIMDEEKSLANIKTRVEDDISKGIWKEYGKTTEDWAKYAHAHHLWYPTTIYKDNKPYAYIVNTEKTLHIKFLDERLFWTVSLVFKKEDKEVMFLTEVWVRSYSGKNDEMLKDLLQDQHLVFTPNGNLSVTTAKIIREPSLKIEREEKEAVHPVNVSQNWVKTPKYGAYNDLLDYESLIKPGDLLNDVDI
ncbi:hypothetical protein OQX61_01655 [Pedobacter sp. PLR]|uniref:hypothetical protein n=1 Tax=Pedobacter sp. PLR TaxID=2994465 RepID=UPI002246D371|nr:hypothetical protein [Pedobacter sp. PLR]MCX2449964.1 hypothetical protein [Pedobacter sp. PLR]